MSAPLALCGLCGRPVREHDHVATPTGAVRVCEFVGPAGAIVRPPDVYAWPLGGGRWQVRT